MAMLCCLFPDSLTSRPVSSHHLSLQMSTVFYLCLFLIWFWCKFYSKKKKTPPDPPVVLRQLWTLQKCFTPSLLYRTGTHCYFRLFLLMCCKCIKCKRVCIFFLFFYLSISEPRCCLSDRLSPPPTIPFLLRHITMVPVAEATPAILSCLTHTHTQTYTYTPTDSVMSEPMLSILFWAQGGFYDTNVDWT